MIPALWNCHLYQSPLDSLHHVGGRTLVEQLVSHKIHVGRDKVEEGLVSLAKIVEPGVAVAIFRKSVFGAFSMTRELKPALFALAWQRLVFQHAETRLLLSVKHLRDGLPPDIAQLVFWKHEVVARIHVAIKLHHAGMPTLFGVNAHARLRPNPICQCGVKQLDKCCPDVILHPFLENGAQKMSPLPWRD